MMGRAAGGVEVMMELVHRLCDIFLSVGRKNNFLHKMLILLIFLILIGVVAVTLFGDPNPDTGKDSPSGTLVRLPNETDEEYEIRLSEFSSAQRRIECAKQSPPYCGGDCEETTQCDKSCESPNVNIGTLCGTNCQLKDVYCVDCRSLDESQCAAQQECTWKAGVPANPMTGTGGSDARCVGIIESAGNVASARGEHCINKNEADCNQDPYCFYATDENSMSTVKAGAALLPGRSGDTVTYGAPIDSSFFVNGYDDTATYDNSEWFQTVTAQGKKCVPKKCTSLDPSACMTEALPSGTVWNQSGKRHCTVASTPTPSCEYTTQSECKCVPTPA